MSEYKDWTDPSWVIPLEPKFGYGGNMVAMRIEHYDALRRELAEAEAALWRITPNTYTLAPGIPDPFEGPGETYRDAYMRLRHELAEARGLLEETETYPSLQKRIDAFLTASDQPDAAFVS